MPVRKEVGQEEADGELQVEEVVFWMDGHRRKVRAARKRQSRERLSPIGDHGQHGILLDAAGERDSNWFLFWRLRFVGQ